MNALQNNKNKKINFLLTTIKTLFIVRIKFMNTYVNNNVFEGIKKMLTRTQIKLLEGEHYLINGYVIYAGTEVDRIKGKYADYPISLFNDRVTTYDLSQQLCDEIDELNGEEAQVREHIASLGGFLVTQIGDKCLHAPVTDVLSGVHSLPHNRDYKFLIHRHKKDEVPNLIDYKYWYFGGAMRRQMYALADIFCNNLPELKHEHDVVLCSLLNSTLRINESVMAYLTDYEVI